VVRRSGLADRTRPAAWRFDAVAHARVDSAGPQPGVEVAVDPEPRAAKVAAEPAGPGPAMAAIDDPDPGYPDAVDACPGDTAAAATT